MTAVTISSADATPIILFALIALILVRRVVGMVRGAQVRPARMFTFAVFYVALFAFTLAISFYELPYWTYGVDAAVLVVTGVLATGWVRQRVVVEWKDGEWTYRLGALIPAIYLVLFLGRLGLDLVVLGVNPFAGPPTSTASLTGFPLLVVAVVDGLFAFSTGLLLGRTVGVYLEYRKLSVAGPPKSTALPPPPAPLP